VIVFIVPSGSSNVMYIGLLEGISLLIVFNDDNVSCWASSIILFP